MKFAWLKRWSPGPARAKVAPVLGPLGVSDKEPWWLTVHQIIDQAEWETIENARRNNTDPNRCMAAVNAGEGVALVRQKLIDGRKQALTREMKLE